MVEKEKLYIYFEIGWGFWCCFDGIRVGDLGMSVFFF